MEINFVVIVWEDVNIIIFNVNYIQFVEQCQGVLYVYIVICNIVYYEKMDVLFQSCDVVDGVCIVIMFVGLRCKYVFFGVDVVVEFLVGDWGNGYVVFEGLFIILFESFEGVEFIEILVLNGQFFFVNIVF